MVTGSVHSGAGVVLGGGSTTVQGDVTAIGDAQIDGTVAGDVLAGGVIIGGSAVAGAQANGANPPAPSAWSLPTFAVADLQPTATFDAGDGITLACGDLAGSARLRITGTGLTAIEGPCSFPSGTAAIVVAEGPVRIDGTFRAEGSGATLAVITPGGGDIEVVGGTTVDSSLTTLLAADGGTISFSAGGGRTELAGAVYAGTVDIGHDLEVRWAALPDDLTSRFSWTDASPARFVVVPENFIEVSA